MNNSFDLSPPSRPVRQVQVGTFDDHQFDKFKSRQQNISIRVIPPVERELLKLQVNNSTPQIQSQ
tara:strand:- start:531 stop:725 length:195 start_codon:yes stop_codon:yes gene_type:complete